MNWIRKTISFIVLLVIFLVAFSATGNAMHIKIEKQSSPKFSLEHIQNTAFIQPQSVYTVALQLEKESNPVIKWQSTFLTLNIKVAKLSCFNSYLNQDINRCEKVSILLFPFHFFW